MRDKIKRLKLLAKESGSDAVLISSVSNIVYLIGYCGFSYFEREAFLVITNRENYLITDGRYSEAVSPVPGFKLIETSSKNTIDKVFKNLSKKIKKIGIEENDLSVAEYKKIRKHFKTLNIKDLHDLRMIKESSEVKLIEKACEIGDEAFNYILKNIKKRITEKELAFEIEMFIRNKGAELSFPSIVAFGKNSSIPHHQPMNNELITHNPVLLDFGVKVNNYCSDMTRTVFFGKANEKFKKIYATVLESQQKAIDYLDSHLGGGRLSLRSHDSSEVNSRGIKASDIDRVARKYIINQGFPTIPHSLGHGIGIEVHEPPQLSPTSKVGLKPGMVFSIEPGIYLPAGRQGLPGFGGVRIEDLVTIQKNKLKLLTHSPKNLIEI